MKLKDIHKDIERYLKEDCYCPHEVYSVDGFFYQLVFEDAECKVIGTFKDPKGTDNITFCITASGDERNNPILLNIWHTDEKVQSMERYDYCDSNVKEILAYLKGESKTVRLSEADDINKELSEIMKHVDAIMM